MSALDAEQLRIGATRAAADEIARGHGDDDIDEAVTHYLITYGSDNLTLGAHREIAADALEMATAAAPRATPDYRRPS